jgi:nucleotide-binding universal stress UspA family protein
MLKILLPVDGSEGAMRAVRHVAKLAEGRDDATVTLLYVHFEPAPLGGIAPNVPRERMKQIERENADPVLAEAEKLLQEAGIKFERDVQAAEFIAPMIAKRAAELGCDAIVMGAYGGGRITKALMGSTATKVVQHVEVPVTLVK